MKLPAAVLEETDYLREAGLAHMTGNWRNAAGLLKDMASRTPLRKLGQRG
jgi:hypothetical protein